MSCNCINQGFFQGDDLVDVIKVNRPEHSDGLNIIRAELQVGSLPPFVEENPVFPYTVSILRDQSVKLAYTNAVYLRIYYPNSDGTETYRTTCLGSLLLKVNAQVVEDVRNDRV